MDPDQQAQDQQPAGESPDYSFPGQPGPDTGALAVGASIASAATGVPLIGSMVNGARFAYDGVAAMYDAHEASQDWDAGNNAAASAEMGAADAHADKMAGEAINAIPLVGFARALM